MGGAPLPLGSTTTTTTDQCEPLKIKKIWSTGAPEHPNLTIKNGNPR